MAQQTSVSKATAQYKVDARLHAVFEQAGSSGKSFDYSKSLKTTTSTQSSIPEHQITAYLSRIQRGGHIQPFGCMIAIDDTSYKVIAYSENAKERLGLAQQYVPSIEKQEILMIGTDVRTLFTSSSSVLLERTFRAREITLVNPVWVHSRNSGKPFYAVLHRIDVGIVIDLEPARTEDPALSIAGAVQSQKLAVRAISNLQALPGGDVSLLCDTVVQNVRELTGYDRVMVYKFHEDEHGEVVAESKRDDLDPYMGLHYPATDIPQASRFLFRQNRVRMIVDCHTSPVRVIQDEALMQPLSLVGSTLRAPHGCHAQYMANMGSIASLAMSVIVNAQDDENVSGRALMKLWGLVVCHHTSARCIPFPLRHACEFLMQAFGLQLNMELQLATQMSEKHILRTQTLLCDMLLRNSPTGIVTQSPSIMDLVKCDGAALYNQGNYYPIGVTPTRSQIKDIVDWLAVCHKDSTGLSTDSLADAGYPGATVLGDSVCGMAVAYITSKDILFWFRSNTAKEIKWGGAKHHPEDKDDGQRMHPRSSFNAFLEVVKSRSLPWENAEMDAIHSLQLILRDSFKDVDENNSKAVVKARIQEMELQSVDELSSVARELVRLIETATAPILAVDVEGRINGWNAKVAELTGLSVENAMGKSLVQDLVYKESEETVAKLLHRALRGSFLISAYAPHSTSREYTLKTQLLKIEMHGDEIPDAYLNRAQEHADALAAIGEPVKDKDLVMHWDSPKHCQMRDVNAQLSRGVCSRECSWITLLSTLPPLILKPFFDVVNTVYDTCNRCGIGHIPSQCPNRDLSTIRARPSANFANTRAQSSNASANWHSDTRANSHVTPDLEAMDNSKAYYGDDALHIGNGIIHRRSCPHTSEQNGFVERHNRHVVETGLTLLAQACVPQRFWHYAFDIAV
ncbi:phytochrome B [Tanacetum coccineum]